MPKVKKNIICENPLRVQYIYFCKGCGFEHAFRTVADGGKHQFNGNIDRPTISPSLLQDWEGVKRCHSFINDGKIQYLDDCQHELAGQTIELPEIV